MRLLRSDGSGVIWTSPRRSSPRFCCTINPEEVFHVVPSRPENRNPFAVTRSHAVAYGCVYPGPRNRGQCRHLQRGARRSAASAGESRRGPPSLHSAKRAGHRGCQHHLLYSRDPRHRKQPEEHYGAGYFLDHRFHGDRTSGERSEPDRGDVQADRSAGAAVIRVLRIARAGAGPPALRDRRGISDQPSIA